MASQKIDDPNTDYNPCVFNLNLQDDSADICEDLPISPLSKWLHATIIRAVPGEVEMQFIVTPQMINPGSVLHGGIQCAILDEVIGITGASLGYNNFLYAIDLKVDYLRKARLGQTLHVKGKIIRSGRSIVNCRAEIFTKDYKLIATGKSNLMVSNE
jgi:uncharacterized protein (TIGR00369 family)